ncbi:MAG: hypothetical protein C4304_03915 [candidate division GAL15 bacterium]
MRRRASLPAPCGACAGTRSREHARPSGAWHRGGGTVRIEVQPTPNVHALKFTLDRRLTQGRSETYTSREQASASPLAQRLLSIPGVRMVFLLNDFVTITREPDADWERIVPEVERVLREHLSAQD